METLQYDDSQFDDDQEFNPALRPGEEGRQLKRHQIRRGIEDYFERKALDRLDDWFDYDEPA
ncbi:PA3496 family putative envelope integrity protein [Motiliproteus sp. SC1-56]|uniref:PA3496 family putative envelope integrity protein n=1 Tax=Motiliproteus sp. SC1-56 TaxID=2799565 RepID=UPI001A9030CB|nr:hypothetical protein [Motiliproteus sp. SC1-56]